MESIVLTKRLSGGFKLVIDDTIERHFSKCSYAAYGEGIVLFDPNGSPIYQTPAAPDLWTIQSNTGFATNEDVVNALDAIFLSPIAVSPVEIVPPALGYIGKVGAFGAEITRPADVLAYIAGDHITDKLNIAKVDTLTLSGESGSASITEAGGLTKTVTFASDLTTSATNFVTDNAAAYLEEGIILTSDGADLIFTASVPGVPFTSPVITNAETDLSGSIANTTANVTATPTPITLANVVNEDGGSGIVKQIKVETNITALASKKIRLWFFNATPTGIVDDNVELVNLYADKSKRLFSVDVEFGALPDGADSVVSIVSPDKYFSVVAKDMYCLIQAVDGFTPSSGGKVSIDLVVLKLA